MAMLTRLALGLATGLVVGVAPHEASARATTIARNGTGKRVLRITTLATFRATGPGGGGPHRQTDRTFAGRIDGRQQRWTVFRWPVRAACSCVPFAIVEGFQRPSGRRLTDHVSFQRPRPSGVAGRVAELQSAA